MSRRWTSERAVAMPMAIMLSLVVAIVIGTIAMNSAASQDGAREFAARTSGSAAADGGVEELRQALQGTGDGAVADEAAFVAALDSIRVADVSAYPLDGTLHRTMIGGADANGMANAWQIVRVIWPADITADDPYITVYVRGWRQHKSNASIPATAPVLVRARLFRTTLAEYQWISDAPIAFHAGVTIDGPIHSNGFSTDQVIPPSGLGSPNPSVWSADGSSVGCSSSPFAQISTYRGTIHNVVSSCVQRPDTGKVVPINSGSTSWRRVKMRCNDTTVRCFGGNWFKEGAFKVVGSGNQVMVYNQDDGAPIANIVTGPGKPLTLAFERSVNVSGTFSGYVTIMSWRDEAPDWFGPTNDINIIGDTQRSATASALGLLAQGSIIVDSQQAACTTRITAALLAATGSLQVSPSLQSAVVNPNAKQCASTLTIRGSIASHGPVILKWTWPGSYAGFASRRYSWDSALAREVPPYWPSVDGWQVIDSAPGSARCVSSSPPSLGECR